MDPLERGILLIVRLVAAALILWSVMDLSLDMLLVLHDKVVSAYTFVSESVPMVLGIVALVKAKALTRWACDKLE